MSGRFFGVRPDYRGLLICNSCWDNRHYHAARHSSKSLTIVDCEGGSCECPCRGYLAEATKRNRPLEPDYSQQLTFLEVDVAPTEHRDDN